MSIFGNIMYETSWYLAQLKPNARRIAERNLRRQGFETFLPLLDVTRRKSTTFVNELRPLFPGYLFIGFTPNATPWRKINSTQGVSRLVSFDSMPKVIPSALVFELRNRCDGDGKLMSFSEPEIGTTVKVTTGPFTDFVAKVEKIDPDKRVWVLLEIMSQTVTVKLEPNQMSSV
jgi:transcriptional antiterminator RfaH